MLVAIIDFSFSFGPAVLRAGAFGSGRILTGKTYKTLVDAVVRQLGVYGIDPWFS